MSSLSLPRIAAALLVVIVLVLGGAFLKLGMNPPLPVQTIVHKDLPGAQFAASPSAAMPQSGVSAAPSLPSLPEPAAAPGLQH